MLVLLATLSLASGSPECAGRIHSLARRACISAPIQTLLLMRLILASQSPRRQQLMQEAGYDFEVMVASDSAEDGLCSGESARDMVARFGKQKAGDVAARIETGVVIGCDTVAEIHGQILGKPRDVDHAEQMLKQLRGREHFVHSGLCVLRKSDEKADQKTTGKMLVEVATTSLWMKDISDAEIEEYLDTDLWIGKAGGFGLQDRTGWLEVRNGSESNVVGLPMELLKRLLAEIM